MRSTNDYFLPLLFGVAFILFCLVIFTGSGTFKALTWETYKNQKAGFEIKYPKGYVYTPCNSFCVGDSLSPQLDATRTDDYHFTMIIEPLGKLAENTDFKSWSKQIVSESYYQSAIRSNKITKLNNYQVRKVDNSSNNYNIAYFISDGKSVVRIIVSASSINSKMTKTISQILSTFKFIE